MLSDDKPSVALDLAMKGSEALEPLLPDGTAAQFSLYGGLLLVATIAAGRPETHAAGGGVDLQDVSRLLTAAQNHCCSAVSRLCSSLLAAQMREC